VLVEGTQNTNRLRNTHAEGAKMDKASRTRKRLRQTFTGYLAAKIILVLCIVAVSATAIVITPTTYQAEIGGALNVTNELVAVDKGFFVASSGSAAAGTSCLTPVLFGVGTVANNLVTAQHVVYDVAVNETGTTTVNTCYQASFVLTPSGGSATTYGPVYMNSTAAIATAFAIDCEFDIGSNAPPSPYSFQLTIRSVP
jgi:hypothetical protein